jgi:hypothetical protein
MSLYKCKSAQVTVGTNAVCYHSTDAGNYLGNTQAFIKCKTPGFAKMGNAGLGS